MTGLKKVLVPIDGSHNSLRALAYVVRQNAKGDRSKIHLLNVQPHLPDSLFVTRAMISEYHLTQSEAALALARRLLAKVGFRQKNVLPLGTRPPRFSRLRSGRSATNLSWARAVLGA